MNRKTIFDGCLLSFWGFIGVGTGIGFAFYAHPALGKLDIMSLAGVTLTVLFALIAGSTFKNYYDTLAELHEKLQKESEQKWMSEFKAKSEELCNYYRHIEEGYERSMQATATTNGTALIEIGKLKDQIAALESARTGKQK